MARKILVLGSTGSIGRSTLEVAAASGGAIRVVGLAAGSDWRRLAAQAAQLRPEAIAIADESSYDALRREAPAGTRVLAGPEGLVELVQATSADFVMSAIVGAAGLPPTLAAVRRGLTLGLANKESLVVAGAILMPLARQTGSTVLPVDSEHSAIFQALQAGRDCEVSRIFLTASGGPFRTWTQDQMQRATLEDALAHPTWSMGPKITIDSATMMNKALEIIEAHHLFGLPAERIEVLVHPQSIVHSMVEFCDGSVVAQLGAPDMKTPIQYALTHPHRRPASGPPLDWRQVRRLDFEPPDHDRFPALRLGHAAARTGGSAGAVLNAANEAAVDLFRQGRIRFGQITALAQRVMERHSPLTAPTLEQLLDCDAWARREVYSCLTC